MHLSATTWRPVNAWNLWGQAGIRWTFCMLNNITDIYKNLRKNIKRSIEILVGTWYHTDYKCNVSAIERWKCK